MSVNLTLRKKLLMAAASGILLAATATLQPWSPSPTNFALAAASSAVISLNNEGVKALNAGNYQLAIQKFEAANKLDPTYTLAKENLAIAYNNYGLQLQNNPVEAIKWFHKSLALNANNPTTQGNLNTIVQMLGKNPGSFKDRVDIGRAARLAGDFDGAIVEYASALRIKDDPKLHADLGDVYRVRDRLDDAIREFQSALKSGVEPATAADINVKLGQAFQAKKDLKSAIIAYGEAIKAKPDDRDVLDALQAGWEQVLRENPQAPENHIGLGQAFQYRGDFQQAEAEYKMALRFDQANAIAKRLMAGIPEAKRQAAINKNINAGVDLQARKQYDLAIGQYTEAFKQDPKNVDVIVNIGTAYQAKGDYDNAIAFYQKAQAIQPSNVLAAQGIKASNAEKQEKMLQAAGKAGQELFAAKKYPEALAAYQKVAQVHPEDPENHFNIGAVMQAMGRIDDALTEYRQAIRLDKENNKRYPEALEAAVKAKAEPIIAKAFEAYKANDFTKAIDLYTQAIGLQSKNVSLYYNLAGALYSRENYPEAQKAYEKALELDPKGQVDDLWLVGAIQEHLGDGYAAMNTYRKYVTQAPNGKFIAMAKDRLEALTKNPNDKVKIKNRAELAAIASATDAYKAGTAAYREKKYDEALAVYNKAFAAVPKEPAYAYAVGTAYHAKLDFDNAMSWYNKAAEILKTQSKPDPQLVKDIPAALAKAVADKAEPIAKAAVEKQNAGDLPGAIALYNRALQLIPNNAALWTNLGSAYQNTDDFAKARDAYQKALDLDKKTQCANYFLVGAIDEHFNKSADAISNYRKYLTECGGGQFAQRVKDRVKILAQGGPTEKLSTQAEIKSAKAIGEIYDAASKAQTAGKWDEAIAGYQKILQLQPKDAAMMFAMGSAYQGKQDFANAIAWYQKAVNLASSAELKAKYKDQIAEYNKYLGIAKVGAMQPLADEALKLFQAQDYKGAAAKYRAALAITPDDPDLRLNLAAALQAADDFSAALPEYERTVQIDPKGKADANYFIAALQEHFGQGPKALDTYRLYVTRVPNGQYVSYAKQRIEALSKGGPLVKIPTQAESKMTAATAETFDKAVKLQEGGKFQEAIVLYQQLRQQFPKEASYAYAEGTAQQQLGNMEAAVSLYEKAVQLDSKNKDYANVLVQAKQLRAAPLIDDAVKKHGAGDLAGAQDAYTKAMIADPKNAKLHTNYAALLQQMDNFQAARDEFNAALALDNKAEGEDYFYLARLEEHFNRAPQAIAAYQKYLAYAPKGQYAAESQSRIKALTVSPTKTIKMQTSGEVKLAGEANAAFDEAVKLQQEKKFDEAIAKYNEALKALPNSDGVYYSLATALFEKQDWDGAIKALENAVRLKPTEAQYKTVLKQAQQAKGQIAATPLLTSAIEKQTKLNDLKGAIADYEAALKLWDDAATHMNCGTAYQADNNFQGALLHYDRALQLDPKLFEVLYYRGLIYENLKKVPQAIADYKKYLQLQPTGPSAAAVKERLKALGVKLVNWVETRTAKRKFV
jgi:tetratricopeptide (TPR) repeat protein